MTQESGAAPVVSRASRARAGLAGGRPIAPDGNFLRLVGEHGALPSDLTARVLGLSAEKIEAVIERGVELGWLRLREYPGEPDPWISLREAGRKRAGHGIGRREPPSAGQLAHRREVAEVRLLLCEERPGWRWLCEADFRECNNAGLTIPDGVLYRGSKRCAVEVERSRKLTKRLRAKLERLCDEYEEVVYFASPHVRNQLMVLRSSGGFATVSVRSLLSEVQQSWPTQRDEYEPSPRARRALRAINLEGIVFAAQLPRLLGCIPRRVKEDLGELEEAGCIRRGLELDGDGGWVWCNHRGAARSGTEMPPVVVPSRGELVRRITLMEVRLDALSRWPEGKWLTRRVLARGHAGKPAGLPRAVIERGGLRYAVVVLESSPQPQKMLAWLKRWKGEYAGVLLYRPQRLAPWAQEFVEKHDLHWVETRDLPRPPADAPYGSLEDESRMAREPYTPTEEERELLRLINAEGLVSEVQLPRVLGCGSREVARLLSSLAGHSCVERDSGWIRCNSRGSRLSGTNMAPATVPSAGYLEQRFQLMEVRLSLCGIGASGSWKTLRQIGREKGSALRQPQAAALLDGDWQALALFFREFRRAKLAALIGGWCEEFGAVRCYCHEADVESFAAFLTRHGLISAEAVPIPWSPDPVARSRQEAHFALLGKGGCS